MPDNFESYVFGSTATVKGTRPCLSQRDAHIDHILTTLDALRDQARSEGLDAMADSISRAFDTCLTRYLSEKEAELIARIATR